MPVGGFASHPTLASRLQQAGGQGRKNRPAQGVDLSHWEDAFNPNAATVPLDFVIYKASEGKGYKDQSFDTFYQASKNVPIKGSYHYLRSGVSTNAQVQTFLDANKGKNIDFFAVDVEETGNRVDAIYAQQARDFIDQVRQKTGKPVFLYTNGDIYGRYFNRPNDKNIPLWFASPTNDPNVKTPWIPGKRPWAIWQKNFGAPSQYFGVKGAQGVDYNVFAGTPDQMRAYLNQLTVTQGYADLGNGYAQVYQSPAQASQKARGLSILESMRP